jgi:hypothetical protein
MELKEAIEVVRVDCNNYIRTVQALQAMANEFLWDDSAKKLSESGRVCFGPTLDTSAQNRVSPNTKVTPDLVIMTPSGPNLLVEAKIALPGNVKFRKKKLSDIQKYDDDLSGLEVDGCRFCNHDIALLVSLAHATTVCGDIQAMKQVGELTFRRRFALIRFFLTEEQKTWFVLELVDGVLSSPQKTAKLRRPLQIDLEHLISHSTFGRMKFYDAEPPLPLLMNEMHEFFLSSMTREQERQLRERNQVDVLTTIDDMRKRMAEACGPITGPGLRTPEIPKAQWIRRAFDGFTQIGWATPRARESYIYHIKKRRDPLGQFSRLCAQKQCRSAEEKKKRREADVRKYPLFKNVIEREE